MFKGIAKILVVSLVLISAFLIKANAQEMIAPQKRALIKELLEVTETKKMAESITDMMLLQMESNYPAMMSQMLFKAGLLQSEEGEKLKNELIESRLRFLQRFRELYSERVKMTELIEKVYYPLYDRYFTEGELRDLIVFYKSPTGKKSINIMPQLVQESMQKSSELLNPKIIQLTNEILEEEKERLIKMQQVR